MWYFISPTDIVQFRDAKPFEAGEGQPATSDFPPAPYPFLGAVRARLYQRGGVRPVEVRALPVDHDLVRRYGRGDDYGRLMARGPLLARRDADGSRTYFPAPLGLVAQRGGGFPVLLRPLQSDRLAFGDLSLRPLWPALRVATEAADEAALVEDRELLRYLTGEPPALTPSDALYRVEEKVGIALDTGRKAADEGMFYIARPLRLADSGNGTRTGFLLDLDVDGDASPLGLSGLLALGGEGRPASYEEVPAAQLGTLAQLLDPGQAARRVRERQDGPPWRVTLYLATPALFEGGWTPLAPGRTAGFCGVPARLVAAAVGRPRAVGGWDLAAREPRVMRRGIPAGSVYYLAIEGDLDAFCATVNGKGVPGQLGDLGRVGFGLAFVGRWDYV